LFAAKQFDGPVLIISRPKNIPYWKKMIETIDPGHEVLTCGKAGEMDWEHTESWFKSPRYRGYVIIHHEALIYSVPTKFKTGKRVGQFREPKFSLNKYGAWSTIIADEAHRFRNRKALMSEALKQVFAFRRWALTGTSMDKAPDELWSVLNWFDPKVFTTYWGFRKMFCEEESGVFGSKPIGLKPEMSAVFRSVVGPYVLRREKIEVIEDLPPKIYKDVPLEMELDHRTLYDQARRETFIKMHEDHEESAFIVNGLARAMLLERIALDPMVLGSDVSGVKDVWIHEFAESFPDQFVVFTTFVDFANNLVQLVDGGAPITGQTTNKEAEHCIQQFNEGKLRYLVGTFGTIGESLNLQAAKAVVYASIHRSSITMTQSEDRVHRMDIKTSPLIIRLLMQGSIDEVLLASYQAKEDSKAFVNRVLKHVSVP